MDRPESVFDIEPLRDAFLARELEGRRFKMTQEEAWVTRIAKDVERDERATNEAKAWLKLVFASEKRDFRNFVPLQVDSDESYYKLFVRVLWLIKANEISEAKELLRKERQKLGLEPRCFYAYDPSRLEPGGDSVFSAPAVLDRFPYLGGQASGYALAAPTSAPTFGASTKTKKFKLPAALKRKQNVSKPTPSGITKRKGAAWTSFQKKRKQGRKSVPKATRRSTARGSNPAPDKNESSRVVSDKSVDGAVGAPPEQQEISQGNTQAAARSSGSKARESARKLDTLENARPKRRRHVTTGANGLGGSKARNSRPSPLPRHKRASGSRTRLESGAPPTKVTSGTTITLSNSQDRRRSVAVSDQAIGSASAPALMEANGRKQKRPIVARRSIQERRSSALSEPSARSSAKTRTQSDFASSGAITELDRGLAHIGAMAQECHVGGFFAPVCSFDNAAENIPDDEDDVDDITMASEYLSTVYVGSEPGAAIFPKQRLPATIRPPIWAQSRQEVCESLESFRSFQSGVYHSLGTVKGYLLGGHSSSLDKFYHSGRLIISHGGGKSEALHSRNRRLEVRGPGDQLEDDRSVHALLENYKLGLPLVLLADDNYRLFPFDLTADGYAYVVLGLYWITHAWAELQQVNGDVGVVRYKFAFQWCEGQGDPWWPQDTEEVSTATQAETSQNPVHQGQSSGLSHVDQAKSQPIQPEISTYLCLGCRMRSPLVYQGRGASMCLQPRCPLFFNPKPGILLATDSPPSGLEYSAELLRLRPANHQSVSADTLFPPSPGGIVTTPRPFAKGMHCRKCGRLSTRFKWENFECSSCHCIYAVPRFRFTHKDFWLQEQSLKFFQHRIAKDSGIVIRKMEFQGRKRGSALPYLQTFELPHNRGLVHLISGHPSINKEANGLFGDYQDQAHDGKIEFRRWPLRNHKCRGQLLSNYFSQNTGAPYQYIGGAERTTPLEDGAPAVKGALKLIQRRIEMTLGKHIDFNEVLSAAYMEEQKMAFHSDSERGLGPVVASLSLGSLAEMHFRLNSKYTISEGHRKVAMSLILRHGDVLVMEGTGVQEYYEHAVVPKHFRIVATARSISPENYAA